MRKAYILFAIAVSALAAVAIYSSQWTSYHDFTGRCLGCHITQPSPGDAPRTFASDMTRLCIECHKSEQELSHPVDVQPSMRISASLPLDWKGDLTCITCHHAHQPGYGGSHLRIRAKGEGFCSICHGDLDSEIHKLSIGAAHTGKKSVTRFMPWELGQHLDELSIKCLSCHDAVTAKDSLVENLEAKSDIFHDNNTTGLSHPIGVSYYEARRKYHDAYRPADKLPKNVRLFDGLVGCATCHNPYSKQHSELVISNEGSALCLACHAK